MLQDLVQQSEQAQRWACMGHMPAVLVLTGPRASGKRTLGRALERRLLGMGLHTMHVDEGVVGRMLGASGRMSQKLSVDFIARLTSTLVESGLVVIVSVSSCKRQERDRLRASFSHDLYHEVYVDRPQVMCDERDFDSLKAFAEYEAPINPDLVLDMAALDEENCVLNMVRLLTDQGCLDRRVRVRRQPKEKRPEEALSNSNPVNQGF